MEKIMSGILGFIIRYTPGLSDDLALIFQHNHEWPVFVGLIIFVTSALILLVFYVLLDSGRFKHKKNSNEPSIPVSRFGRWFAWGSFTVILNFALAFCLAFYFVTFGVEVRERKTSVDRMLTAAKSDSKPKDNIKTVSEAGSETGNEAGNIKDGNEKTVENAKSGGKPKTRKTRIEAGNLITYPIIHTAAAALVFIFLSVFFRWFSINNSNIPFSGFYLDKTKHSEFIRNYIRKPVRTISGTIDKELNREGRQNA